MISNQSILKVINNSGSSKVKCLKILGELKKTSIRRWFFSYISISLKKKYIYFKSLKEKRFKSFTFKN